MTRLFLIVACALECFVPGLAYGQEVARAKEPGAVLPCTCPYWIVGHVGGGAHMYYATFYDEGSDCMNGEVVYYIGDEEIPQTCEGCVPEKGGVKVEGEIPHHTQAEFLGLDPPRNGTYSILDDIRPRVVREHTHVIRRQPCFYEFTVDDTSFRIRAYRFLLAVDPQGIGKPEVPPAFMNVAVEVTGFDDDDPYAPIEIDGSVQRLRGNYAFQVKHKLGEQDETDLLLLDRLP